MVADGPLSVTPKVIIKELRMWVFTMKRVMETYTEPEQGREVINGVVDFLARIIGLDAQDNFIPAMKYISADGHTDDSKLALVCTTEACYNKAASLALIEMDTEINRSHLGFALCRVFRVTDSGLTFLAEHRPDLVGKIVAIRL